MSIGVLQVRLDNGWFACNGLIKLLISTNDGQSIIKYFDPKTLNEDCWALDLEQIERQKERFNERIRCIGIEGCNKVIEAAGQR